MDSLEGRYEDEEEVRQRHIDAMGQELGPVYHDLYNQCLWLHVKWQQFVELYDPKQERIDLLHRSASLFFVVIRYTLWEDTLLNLTRLTDPSTTGRGKSVKENLTLQRLPSLVTDERFKDEIKELVKVARDATAFARDWRNRRIAHRDFALAINEGAQPLAPASRQQVDSALDAISRILERIAGFYFKSEAPLNLITQTTANDAISLLYVIRDGLEAREKQRQRIREGKIEPHDLKGPREI